MPYTSVSKATAKAINALHKQLQKEYDSGDFSYTIFCRGMIVGASNNLNGYVKPSTETPDKIVWTKRHNANPVKLNILKSGYHSILNEGGECLTLTNSYQEAMEWCYRNGCRPIQTSWKVFNKRGYPN
jgi:hypothetical protein